MHAITVDGVSFLNDQEEVTIYPGAGRIKAKFLSIKDKTVKVAKKIFTTIKKVAEKVINLTILKMFLKALIVVGYFTALLFLLCAAWYFFVHMLIALFSGAMGAAFVAACYWLASGFGFNALLGAGMAFAKE